MESQSQAELKAIEEGRELALQVLDTHPEADPETVRHTLLLLKLPPEERLRRALRRGRLYKFTAK